MFVRGLVTVFALWLSVGLAITQSLSREEALEQIQPLVAELSALRAVNAMNLSPEQARDLLAIAKQAQSIWSEYLQRMKEVLREQIEVFTVFYAEDLLNVGFTLETERKTALANLKEKNLKKWLSDSLSPLCDEAGKVLTEEQRSIAEQVSSTNLRSVLRTRLLPSRKQADRIFDPIAEIREELAAIYRAEYGEITPLGRFLLNPALVSALERKLGLPPSPIEPLVDKEFIGLEREVNVLRADISMLNLINGLYLSSQQVEQLARLARAADGYQVERSTEVDPEAFKGLVRSLETMKKLLLNGRDIPLPMLAHAFKLAQRANLFPNPAPQPTGLREIAQQVLSILTEEQKQVLADYKPCLIPPKNLKDPVRVGQAPSNIGYIKALERIRQIPSAVYARRKAQIIDGLAKQIEKSGGAYPPEERDAFIQRLTKLVDRARSLNEADFAMQSEELANELRKLHRKEALEERLKELIAGSEEEVLLKKVIANLLHPRLTVVLTERQLAQANLKPGEGEGLKSLTVYNTGGICPKP
ncbi:MAG: hypothetical protein ACUVTP_07920 [Candidatus Fervidibacter sp.]|uniref:hypothetical protein n=1 Tax=Candidatus Fervidibacter sp. TaxID=3100871 RepID=UPI00404B8616